jgi:hypothetical protein
LGVAEVTHEELVACVKGEVPSNPRNHEKTADVGVDPIIQTYLKDKLVHLTREQRCVIKLVLRK